MVDPVTLAAFVPAALALNLTPGADMMFCLGQGLRAGPAGAWAASAGIALGGMTHVLVAGLGLSALLSQIPVAFDVIRWAGVAYLLWLALVALRSARAPLDVPRVAPSTALRDGFFVNLTNPKVILFVLAFVPQFVRPEAGAVLPQFLLFGAVIATGGFVINGLVGVFAGAARRGLAARAALLHYASAAIFAALAARLAILEKV
jgi:threonine/homoserine/homoserine lactone efflux protein